MSPPQSKSKRTIFRSLRILVMPLLVASASFISGCATSDSAGMPSQIMHGENYFREKVFCTVTSPAAVDDRGLKGFFNSEGHMLTAGYVQDYHDNLVDALGDSELYQPGDSAESSQLLLEITILRVDTGIDSGFGDITDGDGNEILPSVYLVARWRCKKSSTGDVICEKDITTAGTGNISVAAANIQAGLRWLARRPQ
jgi:hypothetical protein